MCVQQTGERKRRDFLISLCVLFQIIYKVKILLFHLKYLVGNQTTGNVVKNRWVAVLLMLSKRENIPLL